MKKHNHVGRPLAISSSQCIVKNAKIFLGCLKHLCIFSLVRNCRNWSIQTSFHEPYFLNRTTKQN